MKIYDLENMFRNHIPKIYMYKKDLALCRKIKPNLSQGY